MPNYSGFWSLVEQGVAEKGGIWQEYVDMSGRAVFGGGFANDYSNVLDYVTIQSTGNATDFGNLIEARYGICGSSNSTRGLKWQGMPAPGTSNCTLSIDYITIASTGNASDFGDLSSARGFLASNTNSPRLLKVIINHTFIYLRVS